MENYIFINGRRIDLTDDQTAQIQASFHEPTTGMKSQEVMLSQVAVGDTVKIGGHEMVTLEHKEGTTALIRKELLSKAQRFGDNNNYDGSDVDDMCNEFAGEIGAAVGEENVIAHTVDLTSDDGLKDYGEIQRRASLLTADRYRKYVEVLDKHKIDGWWWLATPYSTKRHENDSWIKCVAPSGYIGNGLCHRDVGGVRPFCILKSTIFVSD